MFSWRKVIKAASKPEKNNYLYFVADDKGSHIFSENYKNHLKGCQ